MSKKIVGFVPAKGSSSRLSEKNKRRILGVPLYLWAANNLSRVLPRKDIYIDSEDEEILRTAKKLGFGSIRRPAELANNSIDGNMLLEWEASNVDADVYVQHLPPMIFCKKETIEKGISLVESKKSDSVVYLYGEKKYRWTDGKPCYDINRIPNSFDLEEMFSECMGLYVVSAKSFKESKKRINSPFSTLRIDHFENNDIDYDFDFIQAQSLAEFFDREGKNQYIEGIREISERI